MSSKPFSYIQCALILLQHDGFPPLNLSVPPFLVPSSSVARARHDFPEYQVILNFLIISEYTEFNMEQFDQLLTCCICLDRYRTPKLLPCQHSYCMEPCMEGLVDYVKRQVRNILKIMLKTFKLLPFLWIFRSNALNAGLNIEYLTMASKVFPQITLYRSSLNFMQKSQVL